ncbi:TPA: hypothetical protein DDW35_10130 [Candidatus Sumerlaeota bacterium]|nr:hypothetical protein [Candidatus Sumerlaeota bacterium]
MNTDNSRRSAQQITATKTGGRLPIQPLKSSGSHRVHSWRLSILTPALLLCLLLAPSDGSVFAAPKEKTTDAMPTATKTPAPAKKKTAAVVSNDKSDASSKSTAKSSEEVDHWPRTPNTEPSWQTVDKKDATCKAVLQGDWETVAAGKLTAKSFLPMNPTDYAGALGICTVYQPDSAGYFLSAGRRFFVKCTGSLAGTTYSYESLARVGWSIAVPEDAPVAARVVWNAGNGSALPLQEFLDKAIKESPDANAWMVTGMVDFSEVAGRSLTQNPVGQPISASGVSTEQNERVLFTAVITKDGSKLALPASEKNKTAQGLTFRAHYANLSNHPAFLNTSKPVLSMWALNGVRNIETYKRLPKVSSVHEALLPSTVQRAYVSVYAIDGTTSYTYKDPELVDPTTLDPNILMEQRWATENNVLGIAAYAKPRLLLRKELADAIVRISKRAQEQGLKLKMYDGYRPLSMTQRLKHASPGTPYLADPTVGSRHNRGAAVDITLADKNGKDLEMPSDYLDFTTKAHRDSTTMTERARRNMELLTALMASEGFTTLNVEWWHYDAPNYERYPILDVPLWPEKE